MSNRLKNKKIICGSYFLVKPKQTYPTLPRLNLAVHINMTNFQKNVISDMQDMQK